MGSAYLPRVSSDAQDVDVTLLDDRSAARSRTEPGEAIVVGAVGSAAPWFLTGWAHDVEVDFMIDTDCQVTILATTIFERMCAVDPRVRSKLRPCRRRLVSADSSPELELNVVFPGLCCDMLFVVANIGSDGLLGMEYGSPTVVPPTSVRSSKGTVVGGQPINVTITPAAADSGGGRVFDDVGGAAANIFRVGDKTELLFLG